MAIGGGMKLAAACLCLAALSQHEVAVAQKNATCVERADLADGVTYAIPMLMKAVRSKCGTTLSDSGFMATKGDAFVKPFADRQSAIWPGALRLLMTFAGSDKEAKEVSGMFRDLPPETVRPLFDAIIEQKVAKDIKLADCARIERGVELLAPLPVENIGGLVTFLVEMAKVKNPELCPARPVTDLLPREVSGLAEQVIAANRKAGLRVAVAESCTGGLVAAALTEVPGSSAVFERGFVTYSNEAKTELLGVSADIIATFGAVSVACAWAMAQGALARSRADVAVAVSGVAGPGGGSDLKPVGTVVFAVARRDDKGPPDATLERFEDGGRSAIRQDACLYALRLLLPPDQADVSAPAGAP